MKKQFLQFQVVYRDNGFGPEVISFLNEMQLIEHLEDKISACDLDYIVTEQWMVNGKLIPVVMDGFDLEKLATEAEQERVWSEQHIKFERNSGVL